MKIDLVEKKDLIELKQLLGSEFTYLKWNDEKLEERLENPLIKIFKLTEKNAFLGFIELEFLDSSIARINGLSVKNNYRKKGYGTKLVEFALEFLQETGIRQAILLVRKSNEIAKKLYISHGFSFQGNYGKKIQGETIEVYGKNLIEKDYLN